MNRKHVYQSKIPLSLCLIPVLHCVGLLSKPPRIAFIHSPLQIKCGLLDSNHPVTHLLSTEKHGLGSLSNHPNGWLVRSLSLALII
ncbi:hypothetical protein GGS24DRAFT_466414 [Hypoxylon argillaceum]|nr:hypothetical protein GGS24DRAFT_466414 [Hypoxylon argillaceum]